MNISAKGQQSDVDALLREVSNDSMGARIRSQANQYHPEWPENISRLACVPFFEVFNSLIPMYSRPVRYKISEI